MWPTNLWGVFTLSANWWLATNLKITSLTTISRFCSTSLDWSRQKNSSFLLSLCRNRSQAWEAHIEIEQTKPVQTSEKYFFNGFVCKPHFGHCHLKSLRGFEMVWHVYKTMAFGRFKTKWLAGGVLTFGSMGIFIFFGTKILNSKNGSKDPARILKVF